MSEAASLRSRSAVWPRRSLLSHPQALSSSVSTELPKGIDAGWYEQALANIEKEQYQIQRTEQGLRMVNPAQGLEARLEKHGLAMKPLPARQSKPGSKTLVESSSPRPVSAWEFAWQTAW